MVWLHQKVDMSLKSLQLLFPFLTNLEAFPFLTNMEECMLFLNVLEKCMAIAFWKICDQLTLWEQGYKIFALWYQPKTSSCRLPCQRHSSSADCARELFKGSNRLASHLVCTWKKIFYWGLWIFYEWHHKWSSFWAILAHVAWPRAQLLGQSISLKFSLETRLESVFWAFDRLFSVSGSNDMI